MLPPHWKTLQPLLDEALDAAPADRPALLEKWRSELPHLADDLLRLLASHEQAESESFLQGEPSTAAGLFATPLAGQRLGAYTLQEPIGEGGMGSVWLARRDDGRFEGEVAVKLLSLSMQGQARAERFRREGHILARLAHPHIARLLDAGVSPSGQPYLVLEHVRGRHVDVHCNEEGLGLEARIRLFLTLLDAVQHAHGHLVVHRDIKPSNVMVDEAGQLKLLDFGIAKLMTADGSTTNPADAPLTQQAGTLLSPGYAAPEQVQSGTVSTATDVYALGVLLYVLLSGQHPTTRAGSSAAQALHDTLQRDAALMSASVRGDEAAASARGLRPKALQRALAGDLDNIAAKALRREPVERYATAAAFADDLRRHLAHQPVLARKPGAGYLLSRFVQRHRLPLAATAVGLMAALGLGGHAWQERESARLSQTRAQTVDSLLQSLFRGMSPDVAASRSFSARELLDRGLAFIDSRPDLDTETRRAARLRMAGLYRDIGAYKEAAAGFKAEAEEAARLQQPQAQALALWNRANVALHELDVDAGAVLLKEMQSVTAGLRNPGADVLARQALLEGELANMAGRFGQALPALEKARALLAEGTALVLEARTAQSLGVALRATGRIDEARAQLQRSAALHARRGEDATIERLAVSLDIATLDNWSGHFDRTVRELPAVHAELRSRLGNSHPQTLNAVNEMAVAELRLGHLDQARHWAAQLKGAAGATGGADAWRNDQSDTILALADLYGGRSAAAETALRRLLAALLRDEGGVSVGTEQLRRVHAEALLRLGRAEEAETELQTSLNNLLQLLGPKHYRPAAARLVLGCALAQRGKVPEALAHWSTASEVLQRELGPQHPYALAAMAYVELGAPSGSADRRRHLANRVRAELGWQDGASELARLLDEPGPPSRWAGLAPVL